MTDDQHPSENGQPDTERPATIIVPGRARDVEDLDDDELLSEAQQVQDLGSASRSCMAIIAIVLLMALVVCAFLMWAFFIR